MKHLAAFNSNLCMSAVLFDRQRNAAAQPVCPTANIHAQSERPQVADTRRFCSIKGTRLEIDLDPNFAFSTNKLSQELVRGDHVLPFEILCRNRHEISKRGPSTWGMEICLQNIGSADVIAFGLVRLHGCYGPETANVPVEHGTKERRAIKAGPAKPID